GSRRLSQAISEGDGISLIVPATDLESVQVAEEQGAEGVVVERDLAGVREATGLPILWRTEGSPAEALNLGADACLLVAEGLEEDTERLERRFAEVLALGLECVVEVRDADELELALERLDPEILLLSPQGDGDAESPLGRVLDLLPDIPAGTMAIAAPGGPSPDEVAEVEPAVDDGRGRARRRCGGLVARAARVRARRRFRRRGGDGGRDDARRVLADGRHRRAAHTRRSGGACANGLRPDRARRPRSRSRRKRK